MNKVKEDSTKRKHICVVVLGDFGRSPRMQYHALSLAKYDFKVDVVAYQGAEPFKEVTQNDNISFRYMKEVPKVFDRFPSLMRYVLKTFWQGIFLFWTLFNVWRLDGVLLQNPPSIPTLPICWLVCWLRSSFLFIDFHNYGFTILGLSAGKKSFLVKFAKWCEMYFSRKAHKSICVTKAMKDDLEQNWSIRASVFYDCAPVIFQPVSLPTKHSFFMKMAEHVTEFRSKFPCPKDRIGNYSRFTKELDDISELPNRPALLVSSTSWTEDEDFSVLLSALEDYEKAADINDELPGLLVAITGKGPLKEYYEKLISKKSFHHIEIVTLWLTFEDYPLLLACADLGISLHSSSSGLDLPMKVVDMFGCCLPVAALSFNCIDELVKDGVNGRIFTNWQELSQQLQELLNGFPKKETALNRFHKNLENSMALRWQENWDLTVLPLLRQLCNQRNS